MCVYTHAHRPRGVWPEECGQRVCVCARDPQQGLEGCFGVLHLLGRTGPPSFISFHIPKSAGYVCACVRVCVSDALSPTPQPACCPGHRPPPLFLIPVSLGVRSLQATSVCGDGEGKRPVLLQGWGQPPPTPPRTPTPGECNKALAFLEAA